MRVGSNHDDGARVAGFLELFQQLDAAGVGQAHVEQHEIGRLVVGHAQRSRAVVSLQDVITPLFALLPERPTNQLLVVDDQDFLGRHFVPLDYYGGGKGVGGRASTSVVGVGP